MTDRTVTAIYGETTTGGEEITHGVGAHSTAARPNSFHRFEVVKITYREQNLGTYGIAWFDVHSADRVELSVNARSVAEVHYAEDGAA